MKKTAFFLSLLLLASIILPFSSFAAEKTLPDDAVILVPGDENGAEAEAAELLRGLIENISGQSLEISEENPDGAFELSVGRAEKVDPSLEGKPDGSYVIKSYDGGVALFGKGKSGLENAVYDFIRRFGGGTFFGREGMTAERSSILLPVDVDVSYEPFFEFSRTDWLSGSDETFRAANGLREVEYPAGFYHTFLDLIGGEAAFSEKPELFALHGGKRVIGQLCLTNPETYSIVEANVLRILETKHDATAPLQIVSVSQNDNYDYCECENCAAFEKAHGNAHSATILEFANRIADAVKDAGYENVAIDTFAYPYSRSAPKGIVPRDNVIVRLCSIECCFSHTLDDPLCSKNAGFMKDLREWSRICDRLYVWDYTTNYWHTIGIFPNFGVMQRNMQIFFENNVKGVYEEGNYYMGSCNAEFGELRCFLLARLLRDPYCDYYAEMNAFLAHHYGGGWKSIRRFIDIITLDAKLHHVTIGTGTKWSLSVGLNPATLLLCDSLWGKAKRDAGSDEALSNVRRSELSWRYYKADAGVGEFFGILSGKRAREKYMDDLKAFGITRASEQRVLTPDEYWRYEPSGLWFSSDLNAFDRIIRWFASVFSKLDAGLTA